MERKKRLCFLSGTRADYGKIKRVMQLAQRNGQFELHIFVTGMHMHKEFGSTYNEILKDAFKNVFLYINQRAATAMDTILANTIQGFSAYVNEIQPDLIVTHGDRVETLAAAVVGAMNNILVCHIEGGELSGTIDESIRHAVTKLAHVHFVSNEAAKKRVMQLGEPGERIFVIGSPDIDVMLSRDLPDWGSTKKRYAVPFDTFGIALFHPVTTSYANMKAYAEVFVDALIDANENYIVIHPNNDLGRAFIMEEYERFFGNPRFRTIPSVRFEHFLTMLKHAKFIVGNSSAGIREAPVYGVPAVDVGSRQHNRYTPGEGLVHCGYNRAEIVGAIHSCPKEHLPGFSHFGAGNSAEQFINIISGVDFWNIPLQKQFVEND